MENELKISIGEGFSSLFQRGWGKKALGVTGFCLLPVLSSILMFFMFSLAAFKNEILTIIGIILGIIFILVTVAAYIFTTLTVGGYYLLYAHDRANDPNALYRNWSKETVGESFVAGLKVLLMGIIQIPFNMIIVIPCFILFGIYVLSKGFQFYEENEQIINFLFYMIDLLRILIFGILFTKIFGYFVQDLKIESLFSWGNAFKFSKGLKGALWVPLVPYIFNTIMIILLTTVNTFVVKSVAVVKIIQIATSILWIVVMILTWAIHCNLLGQYSYNSVQKNKPEEV